MRLRDVSEDRHALITYSSHVITNMNRQGKLDNVACNVNIALDIWSKHTTDTDEVYNYKAQSKLWKRVSIGLVY